MPLFENHCNHPSGSYAGKFEGADLYFYYDGCWRYCLRTSSIEEDYQALPIHTLCNPVTFLYPATDEERRERSNRNLAILGRFFRHTQVHKIAP